MQKSENGQMVDIWWTFLSAYTIAQINSAAYCQKPYTIPTDTLQLPYMHSAEGVAFSKMQFREIQGAWGNPQQAEKQNLYRFALLVNLQMYIRLHCLPICEFVSNAQRMHTIFRVSKFNFFSAYCIPYHSYPYNKSGTFGKFKVDFGVIFGVLIRIKSIS